MTTKPWKIFQPKKNNGGKNPNCRLPFMLKNKNTTCISSVGEVSFLGEWPWPHSSDNCNGLLRIPACKHLFYLPLTPRGEKCTLFVPQYVFMFAASKYSSTNFFNAWILSGNTAGAPGKLRNSIVNRINKLNKMFTHVGVVVGPNHCGISPSRRFVFVYVANVKTLIFGSCLPVIRSWWFKNPANQLVGW